ncbi:MAG: enoyl-ACP reductase FabV, partial [Gammaproteobacteria bacterium]
MIVHPKIRGFICTTAHPVGCAAHVQQQIDYIKHHSKFKGCNNVLVIGASTGYGLASRIAAAFGAGASTIGVSFERAATDKRTATAGWYNTAAFEQAAQQACLYAKSINGDAFSNEIKQQVIDIIKADWPEGVDLIIYSLASPRRQDPRNGEIYNSELKPIGKPYTNKTVDVINGTVSDITLQPASEADISNTVKVMGGDDWAMWIDALADAGVLAKNVKTVAYSYIGPELTYPVYTNGTIGKAKEHLEVTAKGLTVKLKPL